MKVVKISGPQGSGKTRIMDVMHSSLVDAGAKTGTFNGRESIGTIVSWAVLFRARAIFVDECTKELYDGLVAFEDDAVSDCFVYVVMESSGSTPTELCEVADAGDLLQAACHGASLAAHWWTDMATGGDLREECRTGTRLGKALVAEKLALIHSEASEALEGHRKGLMDEKLPHRPAVEVELADLVIRAGDLAGALGLDLGGAIAEKMEYNRTRPDHKLDARQAEGGKAY